MKYPDIEHVQLVTRETYNLPFKCRCNATYWKPLSLQTHAKSCEKIPQLMIEEHQSNDDPQENNEIIALHPPIFGHEIYRGKFNSQIFR